MLEHGADDDRQRREDEVVEGDVHVVEERLTGVGAEKGGDELRDGEEHVLVEEVENHLADSDVVPPAMHEQQPPQHPKLRQSIIPRLHSPHTLLAIQSHPNMRLLYHSHIICAIANRQRNFFQVFPDHFYKLTFLTWQKTTTDDALAVGAESGE